MDDFMPVPGQGRGKGRGRIADDKIPPPQGEGVQSPPKKLIFGPRYPELEKQRPRVVGVPKTLQDWLHFDPRDLDELVKMERKESEEKEERKKKLSRGNTKA